VEGQLFVDPGNLDNNGSELEIINQLGQRVLNTILAKETLKNSINVSQLVPGRYWVRLKTKHHTSDAVPFIKY